MADQSSTFSLGSLDHEYWNERLRMLAPTHDLVPRQDDRVTSLLNLLELEAMSGKCRCGAECQRSEKGRA